MNAYLDKKTQELESLDSLFALLVDMSITSANKSYEKNWYLLVTLYGEQAIVC